MNGEGVDAERLLYFWARQFARYKGYHRPSPEGLGELWSPQGRLPQFGRMSSCLRKRSTLYQSHKLKKLSKSDCWTFSEPRIAARWLEALDGLNGIRQRPPLPRRLSRARSFLSCDKGVGELIPQVDPNRAAAAATALRRRLCNAIMCLMNTPCTAELVNITERSGIPSTTIFMNKQIYQ